MFGVEPHSMGIIKNFFWGNIREDLMIARHTMRMLGAKQTNEKDVLCTTA